MKKISVFSIISLILVMTIFLTACNGKVTDKKDVSDLPETTEPVDEKDTDEDRKSVV